MTVKLFSSRRARVVLTAVALACATPGVAAAAIVPPPPPANPVVFVHGCLFYFADEVDDIRVRWAFLSTGYWGPMVEAFRASGYPDSHLQVMTYSDACGTNGHNAELLNTVVDEVRLRTGASQVDLVTHSMGCISARLFLKTHHAKVDDMVSIAGVCHGTTVQAMTTDVAADNPGLMEATPAYWCGGVQKAINGCFDESGTRTISMDETPGGVDYRAIYTDTDEVVSPAMSACLDQLRFWGCPDNGVNVKVAPRSHFVIHQAPDVIGNVLAFARRP